MVSRIYELLKYKELLKVSKKINDLMKIYGQKFEQICISKYGNRYDK